MGQGQDLAAIDPLVFIQIPSQHIQPHINPPQKDLHRVDLGDVAGGGDEFIKCRAMGFIERDPKADRDIEPKRPGIDINRIARDHPIPGQPVHPAGRRHCGQPRSAPKIRRRKIGLTLNFAQELSVCGIKFTHDSAASIGMHA